MRHHLDESKAKLQTHQQVRIQQDQVFCMRYQEKLRKTLQDLWCVSDLLNSCTLMDLGSDLQTSRLLEHFTQAEPHFRQLDSQVDYLLQSRASPRGVQVQVGEEEEGLPELLQLQQTVKKMIHQSKYILTLSRTFHLTANQLELLLQSEPSRTSAGSSSSCESREAELSWYQDTRQQIQNLLKTTQRQKTDICSAITQSGSAGFRVEQLEVRLTSLDSLCESWLKEVAEQEEKLLTSLLHDDIIQLRDSFKELKKRFNNTKFNFLNKKDRTRNPKAVRNQLQQVEVFQEKLQALRKRVHGVTAHLVSEVKDGAVAWQVEDAANELQRQMGEFEWNVCEHMKTLDLTCRLQRAMEEYQFWCDEASTTIARVGKFSLECRSTEAVSVLYRQFEKFVWPTVPQQEERISQITELAVRLHGGEEGRRYVQKTVSKHTDMVESITELSHGLMELEVKLKLESLKQQQNDEEEEEEMERSRDEEKKENRKMKEKEGLDNRSSQEAADPHELKETGHTPELTAKHDGKEAAPRRRSQEVDRQRGGSESRQSRCGSFTSSYCSTLSISCSPLETNRLVQTTHSQSQLITAEPQATAPLVVIGPSFSEIQKEFQKDIEGGGEVTSIFCGSVLSPLQDASGHAELQEHEAMMEDFLSNDEYDCVSPDDISLPPLAETPESTMFQSDMEEGFCFSSHSIHVSHQSHPQAELPGPGPDPGVPQQTENRPSPSVNLHSSTRFRPESRSFHQCLSTVPAPRLFTSSLCTILKTRRSSTNTLTLSADLSLNGPEPRPPPWSNPVHDVPQRSCSPRAVQDLSQNTHAQLFEGPNPDTQSQNTSAEETGLHRALSCSHKNNSPTESHHDSKSTPQQDTKSVKIPRETTAQRDHCTKTRTSLDTQINSDIKSLFLMHHCVEPKDRTSPLRGNNPQFDPAVRAEGHSQGSSPADPVPHKDSTDPLLLPDITFKSSANPSDMNLPQSSIDSRGSSYQVVPPFQTKSRDRTLTTTTSVTQQTVLCKSSPSDRFHLDQDLRDQTADHINCTPHPNDVNNKRWSLHTVQSLHEPLTSSPVQQSASSPSISFCSSAMSADPLHSQALSHPANLHVPPTSSSTRLLTPPRDPDICQPMFVREEIRLTPQIHGPPIPPPPHLPPSPPQAQVDSLVLGTVSRPGPPCFTRPLSRAIFMEGSPVTLEVGVVERTSEPSLTWFTGGEESTSNPCLVPPSEDSEPPSMDLETHSVDLASPSMDSLNSMSPSVDLVTSSDSVLPSLDFTIPSLDSDPSTFHPNPYQSVENSSDSYLFVETSNDSHQLMEDSPSPYWSVESSRASSWAVETSLASCQSMDTNHDSYWSVETSPSPYWSVESSPAPCRSAASSRSHGCDEWLGIEVFDIISEDWNIWFGTLCVLLWLMYLILL